jgi:hypothetical protein
MTFPLWVQGKQERPENPGEKKPGRGRVARAEALGFTFWSKPFR